MSSTATTILDMQFTRGDRSESDASARQIPCLVILSLVFFCLLASTGQSWADDYDVDFGVEARGAENVGSVSCRFDQVCSATIAALSLRLTIDSLPYDPRSAQRSAQLHLSGSDPSCCYFAGAADSKIIDMSERIAIVPFYRGRPARRLLLIQNEYVGTLYIRIRRRRDH